MKKIPFLSLLGACSLSASIATADILAQWTFELNTPADLTDSAIISGIAADFGSGTASGVHASAATDWTTPAGNGSTNSLSANTWAVGDYFEFSLSTLGYSQVEISFDQTGSNTGPGTFGLFYSANGSGFLQFGSDYTLLVSSWNATTYNSAFTYTFDLSAITALDDAATVAFRLVNRSTTSINGGTVAAGGTGRVDNFAVTATPIPEPSVAGFLGGLGMLALFLASKRK